MPAVFRSSPFPFTQKREPCAVDDQMQACAPRDSNTREVEVLATPGERGVVGRVELDAQYLEERLQKPLSLTEWQVEDETERQRSFDGHVGVLLLPSTRADAHGLPGVYCLR